MLIEASNTFNKKSFKKIIIGKQILFVRREKN